jgi:glutathione S-transferase
MQLVIANKAYSSWSLRAWLVTRHFEIPVEEILIPLDQPDTHDKIRQYSPSGRVPCLVVDDTIAVWESLAIIEFLAETYPDKPIWPQDRAARALARSISNEMHAGFMGLRKACPMNLRKTFTWRDFGREASEDAVRIVELWRDARSRLGSGGPFLFGAFTAADAMFAPVVTRFHTYGWPIDPDIRSYMDAVLALPAFQDWLAAAKAEPWIVPSDEIE